MKKLIFSVFLTTSFVPFLVFANTITFNGRVSSNTCEISINGNKTTPVILLPTTSDTLLANHGAADRGTQFSINLKNCGSTEVKANTKFTAQGATIEGNLSNIAGTAENIQVQLIDGVSSHMINFNANDRINSSEVTIDPSVGASIPFIAKYYSADTAIAGTVITSTVFSIVYQ